MSIYYSIANENKRFHHGYALFVSIYHCTDMFLEGFFIQFRENGSHNENPNFGSSSQSLQITINDKGLSILKSSLF